MQTICLVHTLSSDERVPMQAGCHDSACYLSPGIVGTAQISV